MEVRILGAHNCETRDTRCMSLVIDGVLALDAGGLTSSLSFPEQKRLRALLVTHHHYDHIRDIPALGMNLFLNEASIEVCCTQSVREVLESHWLNGDMYPKFFERPPESPTFEFTVVEPYRAQKIAGYSVLPVPVNHAIPALGYQISSPEGKALFYTGDTGAGLSDCWQHISPELLMIEITAPNRYEEAASKAGHLTLNLLKQELAAFRELKGYLPRILAIHMTPYVEAEIEAEAKEAAEELGAEISLAREGMRLTL